MSDFDEATVELVAGALDNYACAPWPPATEAELFDAIEAGHLPEDYDVDEANRQAERWIATQILTALAEAGRLLPPGGEERTEWGVLVTEPHPRRKEKAGDVIRLGDDEDKARWAPAEVWAGWVTASKTTTTWPDGSTYTTAWQSLATTPEVDHA